MKSQNASMRIFWPLESLQSSASGILVGWRNSDLDVFVVTILENAQEGPVEHALRMGTLFRNSPYPMSNILALCGPCQLEVLGVLNPTESVISGARNRIVAYTSERSSLPQLHTDHDDKISSVQMILLNRPQPSQMQYISAVPISLAITNGIDGRTSKIVSARREDESERGHWKKKKKQDLVEKLKLHTVKEHIPDAIELALPAIVNQINCSFEIHTLLHANIDFVRPRHKRAISVSERVVESATDLWHYVRIVACYMVLEWAYPLATKLFIFGLISHRVAGEIIVLIVDWRPAGTSAALRDLAATAQQVDLRLQQFCYWPIQYLTLRERKDDWESITNSHAEYIRFYNSLWLVANDVIIGIAIGTYVIENADFVTAQADYMLRAWSLEGLQAMISWLMDYPAGLKLNNDLAKFLGDLFLWVIDCWAGCIGALRPGFPHIVRFVGFASFAGATMSLSLVSDLVSLFTLHIHCFYIASARIYSWQLAIITSLFHLFRGKKRNVLRNRIDSCDYELDQLLLGTILFTLLFFLLPTVAVFYLTFASARMGIILLKALLDTQLACLNHFPIFALMLRFKDPARLPSGIRFELHNSPLHPPKQHANLLPTSYIILKPIPLSFMAMFNEYFQLGNRIRKHYLSPSVLLCLASGGFVPPLDRRNLYGMQYSMLPSCRVGIVELWHKLNGHGSNHGYAKHR